MTRRRGLKLANLGARAGRARTRRFAVMCSSSRAGRRVGAACIVACVASAPFAMDTLGDGRLGAEALWNGENRSMTADADVLDFVLPQHDRHWCGLSPEVVDLARVEAFDHLRLSQA